ncbi:cytidine deaminase [Roseateles sp. YR242]|uniref:cytidine deaminase n=1 Tax=Roseateles sp. YR242 TaxID=1855305 RepID=UPI0008AC163B|nr:cytidine deaminase [Roseateles sp. YR242]SEL22254.1 cytidine deaminase [Roseateles sp. YR242]
MQIPGLTDQLVQQLLKAAMDARQHSHAPYSNYLVGAAVLDEHGRIHAGCNIENAAYPQGWCAETTALSHMIMAGGRTARAVMVTGAGSEIITPCGGCRQKLREFAQPTDLIVIAGDASGVRAHWTLEQLLPASFGPDHLKNA